MKTWFENRLLIAQKSSKTCCRVETFDLGASRQDGDGRREPYTCVLIPDSSDCLRWNFLSLTTDGAHGPT